MNTLSTMRGRRRRRQGQGVVEFAILLPVFMIVLFSMLEFGIAFSHHLTLEYATRDGARVGAVLANGTKTVPCADVDEFIIAAVQRVITSPGSNVDEAEIQEIRIYKADNDGADTTGLSNRWIPGSGPIVEGTSLLFAPSVQPWNACGREEFLTASAEPDSIGVSVSYDYNAITPLGTLLQIAGAGNLRISDRTVMALEPFPDG